MIELTVKTLDSKNHAFSVPDDVTVKQLKERIAESISIPADSQRLIYCGRVLQDEKNLSEYDVNGKVIHLVQRAPPGSNTGGSTSSRTTTGAPGGRRNQQWRNFFGHGGNSGNAMYLGAMAFPAEIVDLSAMRQPRQCLSQSRLDVVRSMLQRCATLLNWLEDPSTETAETNGENSRNESTQPANNDEANSASAGAAAAAVASTPLIPEETFVIDGQQIDTVEGGTVNSEAAPDTASEQNRESPDGEAQASAQQPAENGEAPSRYPRTTALAELIDQTVETNTRLQPFMAEYQQLLRDDPSFVDNAAQLSNRLFSHVSEIMHNMAHAYHALSDIMCDFEQPPPRVLRCRPVLIQHSAVVQTGIPIQVSSGPNDNAGQETANGGGATAAATPADGPARPTQESSPSPTQLPEPPLEWAEQARLQEARVMANRGMRFTRVDGPPGLEVFVDVGPGSITIDSVETTVVTNASGNTTEQNGWQNPPEFVQSLLTAVAGQLMGAPGLTPGLVSVAPATTSAPPGAPTGAQNSQARGNTATHPTTATQTRSTPRPHVHLAPSINGLRTNNFDPFLPCNSHHIRSGRGGRQRTGQNQAQNPTNPANPTNPTNQATPAEPRDLPRAPPSNISISVRAGRGNIPVARIAPEGSTQARLAAELQRFIQERRGTDASAPQGALYPPQFVNLLQAMRNPDSPTTLAQALENMPGYSYTPGESILIDIFMALAQSLSFMDMVQLGLGRSDCLVRARPRLRQLISERLLNNQPLTSPAITRIIDTFNAELTPVYNTFNRARLREEVDLPASVNLYNHSTLPAILHTIIDEDESTFHSSLMQKSISYVRQLCALILYCCLDGEEGMEGILHAFVVQMTVGVPDVLQDWTMSQSFINFRSFVTTINSNSEDVKRYLVYQSNKPAGSSQASTRTPPVAEPMDTLDLADMETPNNTTVILNPDWQNPLPSDWVPIITRDSQRQRRQNPQGPFSDAYMSGMPSKRRKLITSAKPQGNLSQVISESMATALGAAGMSSGPEVEVVAQRAGEDTQLRSAYREQIRSTLHYNLNTNQDYLPEKYPNTTKYLKK